MQKQRPIHSAASHLWSSRTWCSLHLLLSHEPDQRVGLWWAPDTNAGSSSCFYLSETRFIWSKKERVGKYFVLNTKKKNLLLVWGCSNTDLFWKPTCSLCSLKVMHFAAVSSPCRWDEEDGVKLSVEMPNCWGVSLEKFKLDSLKTEGVFSFEEILSSWSPLQPAAIISTVAIYHGNRRYVSRRRNLMMHFSRLSILYFPLKLKHF